MCPFELLHFVPLVLIVVSVAVLRKSTFGLYSSLAVIVLSVIGIFSGAHMHTEHAMPLTIIDPCYGYVVSLSISSVSFIRNILISRAVKG
jgi:uncharacterized membrane protein